jgi:hypothetical protein
MACFAKRLGRIWGGRIGALAGFFWDDQDTAFTLHRLQTFAVVSSSNFRS